MAHAGLEWRLKFMLSHTLPFQPLSFGRDVHSPACESGTVRKLWLCQSRLQCIAFYYIIIALDVSADSSQNQSCKDGFTIKIH